MITTTKDFDQQAFNEKVSYWHLLPLEGEDPLEGRERIKKQAEIEGVKPRGRAVPVMYGSPSDGEAVIEKVFIDEDQIIRRDTRHCEEPMCCGEYPQWDYFIPDTQAYVWIYDF